MHRSLMILVLAVVATATTGCGPRKPADIKARFKAKLDATGEWGGIVWGKFRNESDVRQYSVFVERINKSPHYVVRLIDTKSGSLSFPVSVTIFHEGSPKISRAINDEKSDIVYDGCDIKGIPQDIKQQIEELIEAFIYATD